MLRLWIVFSISLKEKPMSTRFIVSTNGTIRPSYNIMYPKTRRISNAIMVFIKILVNINFIFYNQTVNKFETIIIIKSN
jgi:hypothetical protein